MSFVVNNFSLNDCSSDYTVNKKKNKIKHCQKTVMFSRVFMGFSFLTLILIFDMHRNMRGNARKNF